MAAGPGISAFCAVIGVVELDYILERADLCISQLGQVTLDIVVEVDFDDSVLGLVGESTVRAPVPIPPLGRDDGLMIGDFRA